MKKIAWRGDASSWRNFGVARTAMHITIVHTGAGEKDSNLHDKVFEICSKLELLLLLSDIVHCKRIRPLISDCSKFKTRKIHVTLKYRNDRPTTLLGT